VRIFYLFPPAPFFYTYSTFTLLHFSDFSLPTSNLGPPPTSNKDLRLLEIRRELLDLKQINQLPPKSQLWEFIHRNYTYKGMKSKEKADMILEFYP